MADERDMDRERLPEHWHNKFEDQCFDHFESQTNDVEGRNQYESEFLSQKMWSSFQNSATSIAQLYKDRHQGLSLWAPFQNAASSVTVLYKDSLEAQKKALELGIQCGMQRKNKEILSWVKKRKRHIRREDLIAFLCGKTAPPRHRMSPPRHRMSPPHSRPSSLTTPLEPISETVIEPDLHTFREALSLQGLNGAMSNITVGYGQSNPSKNNSRANVEELNCFIAEEIFRNCDSRKRTASSTDVRNDSPSRKKSRLF